MTNNQVAAAWVRGQDARAKNLRAEAGRLYSYALCIGVLQIGFHVTLYAGPRSQTTARHLTLARRAAQAHGLTIGEMS